MASHENLVINVDFQERVSITGDINTSQRINIITLTSK